MSKHKCSVPGCDGTRLGHSLAEDFPDETARIDAAIRQVAARGGEFSANDVRPLLGDLTGPLVGARFNALAKAGEIEHVGFVKSSKGSTNAHRILTWRAA